MSSHSGSSSKGSSSKDKKMKSLNKKMDPMKIQKVNLRQRKKEADLMNRKEMNSKKRIKANPTQTGRKSKKSRTKSRKGANLRAKTITKEMVMKTNKTYSRQRRQRWQRRQHWQRTQRRKDSNSKFKKKVLLWMNNNSSI